MLSKCFHWLVCHLGKKHEESFSLYVTVNSRIWLLLEISLPYLASSLIPFPLELSNQHINSTILLFFKISLIPFAPSFHAFVYYHTKYAKEKLTSATSISSLCLCLTLSLSQSVPSSVYMSEKYMYHMYNITFLLIVNSYIIKFILENCSSSVFNKPSANITRLWTVPERNPMPICSLSLISHCLQPLIIFCLCAFVFSR